MNQATDNGTTALHIAAQNGHKEIALLLKLAGAKRLGIDLETNDTVIKQAIKVTDILQIITQRFPESSTNLYKGLDVSLDNIVDIDNLLQFSIGLEKKFNQIMHPTSTADISHMVNQFFSGKLSDKLIRDIANPQISCLDKQSLMGAIKPEAKEAQIISCFVQGSLPLSRSRAQDSILELQDRIIKLNSIGINLSVINVSNVDGVYMYHYDAAGAGAEMAQIPLSDLNKNQRADLERKISIQEQQSLDLDCQDTHNGKRRRIEAPETDQQNRTMKRNLEEDGEDLNSSKKARTDSGVDVSTDQEVNQEAEMGSATKRPRLHSQEVVSANTTDQQGRSI